MTIAKDFLKFFSNPYKTDKATHRAILKKYPNIFNRYLNEMVIFARMLDEDKFSRALDVIFEDFGEELIPQFGGADFDPRDLLKISNNKLLFIAVDKILSELIKANQGAAIIKEGELFYKIFTKAALNYRNDPSQASPAEFVKIIDKHFKEKEIPAEFLFENEKSAGKSVAPAMRLSPVGALEGNPWSASCSPGLEPQKRTILLQGSFFEKASRDDLKVLEKQLARLINEGFEIVYFEGDEVKKVQNALEFRELNLAALPNIDVKQSAQILAKKSIAISEVVILNGDNCDILKGVFFNELELFNSQLHASVQSLFFENNVLKIEYDHSIERPNKDNISYLVRNNIKLTQQQMEELQEIIDLNGGNNNQENFLRICLNAVFADNEEVLKVLCNELSKIFKEGDVPARILAVRLVNHFATVLVGPHEKIVRTLLESFPPEALKSRLSTLKEYYNFELAKIFIENLTDEEKVSKDAMDLWIYAATEGDFELCKLLRDNSVPMNEDEKPLYLTSAVLFGHRKIIEMLLDMGLDVNAEDVNQGSALLYAIRRGDKDIVELLIAKNVNLMVRHRDNDILRFAIKIGYRDIVELLIEKRQGFNHEFEPLLIAVTGCCDVVQLLLEKYQNPNPDIRQKEINNALLECASSSSIISDSDMVALLLDYGADVNAVDDNGFTPLMLASKAGCKEIVRYLIDRGANIDQQNSNGDTALILAAEVDGNSKMVEMLLRKGANWEIANNSGRDVFVSISKGGDVKNMSKALRNCNTQVNINRDMSSSAAEIGADAAPNASEEFDTQMLEILSPKTHDEKVTITISVNGGKTSVSSKKDRDKSSGADDRADAAPNAAPAVDSAPQGFYFAKNGKNGVDYFDDENAVFEMSQVGEPLNLDKISASLDEAVRVREGVFDEVKDGKFERNKEAEIVGNLSKKIKKLRKAFNKDAIANMKQATDFGYALLKAETSENQDTQLFGVNFSYEIVAIKTDPENAVIKSLTIDEDGFYHVKTDRQCSVSYVLKFDHQLKKIKGNAAVDFIEDFQKSFNSAAEIPQKDSYANHEDFLEAVYESKATKASCGLRVEVALHMMKKKKIDISNIKICGIDGSHTALETKDANGKVHYLELGGASAETSYDHSKYNSSKEKNVPQGAEDAVAVAPRKTIGGRIFSALSRIPAAISHRFRPHRRVGLGPTLPTSPDGFRDETVVNPLFLDLDLGSETLADEISTVPSSQTLRRDFSLTAQDMQEFSRKKPRQLLSNAEFASTLKGNKSPTLYIGPNTELLTNNIALNLQQNSKKYSKYLGENGVPVFILNNPALVDLDKSKFKIAKNGEVVFDEKGFLSDFLAQVKSHNNSLRELEGGIVPADFKPADLAPTLIIDWSKFNSTQRVALNSLLDENPAINKHDFSGIKIISLDKSLSKDSSFVVRHQDFYEVSSTIFSAAAKPVASSVEGRESQFDLQGFDNWKATLFGNIILENGQTKWQKSNFVEELEEAVRAEKTGEEKTALIFNISNSSNNLAVDEFLQMSSALGYFTYQGYQIPLPQNASFKLDKAPFNFKQFNKEHHLVATNITINQIPDDCQITNGQIFDLLLCQTKIRDENYIEELGLIAQAATSEGKTLKLFITSQLTDAQFYVLFSEAKKHEVNLELCLAPEVKLPRDLELQAQVLPARSKVLEDNKLKSAIVLTKDSSQIIEEILAQEKSHQTTLPENKDIFVLNVEDFSYENLVKKTSYVINPNGSFSSFEERQSAFIDWLKDGKRIILKGEFSAELLQALQPILLENYAQNLMLIIENRAEKSVNLNWLEPDLKLDIETTPQPKEIAEEKFDANISAQDFIAQRNNLFTQHFNANQMLHLVGISGVGKSTLVEEFSRENNIPLYCGLDSLIEFAKNKTPGSPKILFIDESNIEDSHLKIFEELKRGEKRILYKGEIIELDDSDKIIFASNPVKFGGGRNEQKLFSDKRIQQIDLSPMPASYIMHLLERDIFAKCTIAEKGEIEDFRNACHDKIAQYNEKLGKENALTIREVQQCALEYLSAKASDNFQYEKLQTPNFISTTASEKIEKEILQIINIYRLQRQGKLPMLGTPGILLEGLPGIGKSVILEAYLQTYLPDSFIKISSSNSLQEKQRLLEEAYEKGKIVVIEELDASIAEGLEKPLNLALSNSHPKEAKQKQLKEGVLEIIPGFTLFATANGIAHEGRKLISPALRHRMKCPELDATKTKFEKDEVVAIIQSWSDNFKAIEGKAKPIEAIKQKISVIADAFLQMKREGTPEAQEYSFRDLKSYCRKEFQELGMVEARGIRKASHSRVLDMSQRHGLSASAAC